MASLADRIEEALEPGETVVALMKHTWSTSHKTGNGTRITTFTIPVVVTDRGVIRFHGGAKLGTPESVTRDPLDRMLRFEAHSSVLLTEGLGGSVSRYLWPDKPVEGHAEALKALGKRFAAGEVGLDPSVRRDLMSRRSAIASTVQKNRIGLAAGGIGALLGLGACGSGAMSVLGMITLALEDLRSGFALGFGYFLSSMVGMGTFTLLTFAVAAVFAGVGGFLIWRSRIVGPRQVEAMEAELEAARKAAIAA